MSSFVIAKEEYIKAAGVVAGIAKELRDFWLYNYEKGRKYTEADYYDAFSEFYNLNALSVQMQYGDKTPETDSGTYEKEFNSYMKIGVQIARNGGDTLKNAALELNDFFRSAIYQTEYEPYMWKMSMFFDRVISQLFEKMFRHECNSWGSLNISAPASKYQKIY